MSFKKMNIVKAGVLALSMMTSVVYAAGAGFYIGGQMGMANTNNIKRDVYVADSSNAAGYSAVPTTASNTGFGGRFYFGYSFSPYFGMEAGYTHYPASTYKPSLTSTQSLCNSPQIRENALDVLGKGTMQFSQTGLGVFAKGGVTFMRQSLSGSFNQPATANVCSSSSNGTTISGRPTVAVGVDYALSPNWETDLTASRVFKGSNVQNADMLSLGVSYHFADKYCGQFLC